MRLRRPALPRLRPGSVWLVGAGPGDPGLMTRLAASALRQADVVVHDALVDEAVLGFVRRNARLEFMGKRGGQPSPRQSEITERLITLAREGQRVVRLKGGDPYVFGRGGEEALALSRAGIPFRVVPGVTAGLGGLALAGIPATTRETNHAVILATGHLPPEAPPDSWATLARTGAPIILYMAMADLAGIMAGLAAGGLAGTTPVAIVTDATTARQRVLVTTLATAARDSSDAGLGSPAIVCVGSVVALRAVLGPALEESTP